MISKMRSYFKSNNKANNHDFYLKLIVPCILCILICCFCLAGVTWAWYSESISSGKQSLSAANFNIDITINDVTDSDNIYEVVPSANNKFLIQSGKKYKINIDSVGSTNNGYIHLKYGENEYFSEQLSDVKKSISFTLVSNKSDMCEINCVLGTFSGTCNIMDGNIINLGE